MHTARAWRGEPQFSGGLPAVGGEGMGRADGRQRPASWRIARSRRSLPGSLEWRPRSRDAVQSGRQAWGRSSRRESSEPNVVAVGARLGAACKKCGQCGRGHLVRDGDPKRVEQCLEGVTLLGDLGG
eukprot:scaffold91333_cov23-Tisochrysis_lutea.AAC.4